VALITGTLLYFYGVASLSEWRDRIAEARRNADDDYSKLTNYPATWIPVAGRTRFGRAGCHTETGRTPSGLAPIVQAAHSL